MSVLDDWIAAYDTTKANRVQIALCSVHIIFISALLCFLCMYWRLRIRSQGLDCIAPLAGYVEDVISITVYPTPKVSICIEPSVSTQK
jgi:hypothetical protein